MGPGSVHTSTNTHTQFTYPIALVYLYLLSLLYHLYICICIYAAYMDVYMIYLHTYRHHIYIPGDESRLGPCRVLMCKMGTGKTPQASGWLH